MVITAALGLATGLADSAVDIYHRRLQHQLQRRRIDSLRLSMIVTAAVASVGMVADVVTLQVRLGALQAAVDEAIAAGDLVAAEQLRGQLVTALQEPTAAAKLLNTLAEYIPAIVSDMADQRGNVIEGEIIT